MKKKNVLFIFSLILFVCISGCDVLNPVIDPWWEGADALRDIDGGYMFTQEAFVVSFDSGGGNYVDSINGNSPSASPQRVWAHTRASVPGLVAKGDDYFTGWYTASSGGTEWEFGTMPVENDMTLYAQWKESGGHTVDFIVPPPVNGYNVDVDLTYKPLREYIADGELAVEPLQFGLKSGPYVNKYVFAGWYDALTGGNKWDFATMTVDGAMVLYARWAEIVNTTDKYTIQFYSGADKNPPPDQHVKVDNPVIAPYVTFRSGYSFGGWYKDDAYTEPWVFSATDPDDIDKANPVNDGFDGATDNVIKLYARWAPVDPVDVLKDVDIVDFTYILFSGGQREYNKPAAPGSSTNLTPEEIAANNGVIDAIVSKLNSNPRYRIMVVGHANPATEADKADPMNPDLMLLSTSRAMAVEEKLKEKLGLPGSSQYDYDKTTPIIVRAEGGRRALNNPLLSRRVEIIVFDIITEVVTP